MDIAGIDLSIIGIYLITVLCIGIYFARKEKDSTGEISSADYFLAGKKLSWPSIGLSLFASNISSTTLIGLAGAAYATGISISNYEWVASVVLVFFAIFFIPYYVGTNIFTMPEFLEKRFDSKSRYYFSLLTIVGNVFIDTAGTLYAGSLVIQFFFPQIEFWQSATILALIAGIYTALGGLAAVVFTDVIQATILFIGSIFVTYLAYDQVGPWEQIVQQTPSEMLSVIRPVGDQTMPWTGLIVGVPILGFYFWCTNQFIVQRVLGAKNIAHARWGALFAGLLKLPVLFIMVYPGIMARLIWPDLETPDLVFPTLVSELLPIGMKGLVLAGLIAAIMSSIDSTLHSASTLVTMDFVKKMKPHLPHGKLTRIGQVTTLIFMVISILWVPVIAQFETLFHYLQSALAYLVPPVVAVFILGLFNKRINSQGALAGLILGHGFSLTWYVLQSLEILPNVHFLHLAGLFFGFSVGATYAVSLLYAPPDAEHVSQWVWSKKRIDALLQKEKTYNKWWQDYRVWSVILLVLTAWIVVANW